MKQEIIEKINKFFLKRIPILLFLFVLVNLFAYLPSFNIFIDIFSHFKLQYFFISIIFLLFSIYLTFINKKLLICTIISLIMIAVNLIGICPQYIPFEPSSSNAASIKLGVFNVLTSNSQYPLLIKEIEEQQPDIIILQETDNIWLNNIKQLKNEYPYYIEHKSTKLKDAQTQNKILKGTWNAKHPFFMRISLDHVLYSEFLGSSEFRIGNSFGSDHLPVFVNISTKE